ncbi:MAG: pyridoxal phosphate-dependent aminotransferase [Granulosicoccus sp.]
MKYAAVSSRLASLGGEKWRMHALAMQMQQSGREIINLTIGEPDVPTPPALVEAAADAMRSGRTGYSDGRGEQALLDALARRYSHSSGRQIGRENILCFPGTQTALYTTLMGIAETGDEVLVGDPMYATYAGVVAASGATLITVPLKADNGFRLSVTDVASRITGNSRAILINTPHNPTGAILSSGDIRELGDLAIQHDLWIIVDEVYEELVFADARFISPLAFKEYSDRVIAVSSISKSHAAPGFRSGWCIGPAEFCSRVLPMSETMLFGNQPFIADMTVQAISNRSDVAAGMCRRFSKRAKLIATALDGVSGLRVNHPQAGMFVLVNIASTYLSGDDFAMSLLKTMGVAVMPGSSFGESLNDWVRMTLTVDDEQIHEATRRIAEHAEALRSQHRSP